MVLKCPKVYFYKDLDLLLPVADNLPLFCCYLSIKKIIFIKQGFVWWLPTIPIFYREEEDNGDEIEFTSKLGNLHVAPFGVKIALMSGIEFLTVLHLFRAELFQETRVLLRVHYVHVLHPTTT